VEAAWKMKAVSIGGNKVRKYLYAKFCKELGKLLLALEALWYEM
jgi:hypothetical protein